MLELLKLLEARYGFFGSVCSCGGGKQQERPFPVLRSPRRSLRKLRCQSLSELCQSLLQADIAARDCYINTVAPGGMDSFDDGKRLISFRVDGVGLFRETLGVRACPSSPVFVHALAGEVKRVESGGEHVRDILVSLRDAMRSRAADRHWFPVGCQ